MASTGGGSCVSGGQPRATSKAAVTHGGGAARLVRRTRQAGVRAARGRQRLALAHQALVVPAVAGERHELDEPAPRALVSASRRLRLALQPRN